MTEPIRIVQVSDTHVSRKRAEVRDSGWAVRSGHKREMLTRSERTSSLMRERQQMELEWEH
jgi:hypothetical protein